MTQSAMSNSGSGEIAEQFELGVVALAMARGEAMPARIGMIRKEGMADLVRDRLAVRPGGRFGVNSMRTPMWCGTSRASSTSWLGKTGIRSQRRKFDRIEWRPRPTGLDRAVNEGAHLRRVHSTGSSAATDRTDG
jgi:hypothetical protein